MERTLGTEIAVTFRERLRCFYAQEDQALPSQMTACLERLKHAEEQTMQPGSDRDGDISGLGPSATR